MYLQTHTATKQILRKFMNGQMQVCAANTFATVSIGEGGCSSSNISDNVAIEPTKQVALIGFEVSLGLYAQAVPLLYLCCTQRDRR
jgi:hypothetical protein